jgi:hypothetical protein
MRLNDRLYQETDDSCGLCGLPGPDVLGIHHIDGNSGNNVYENTIVLCHNCHRRFHDGKGVTEEHIRGRKKHLIHKTLTTYGLNALKIADRHGAGVVAMPFLLHHLVELGYLESRETVMDYSGNARLFKGQGYVSQGFDMNAPGAEIKALARFEITPLGVSVLQEWFGQ